MLKLENSFSLAETIYKYSKLEQLKTGKLIT